MVSPLIWCSDPPGSLKDRRDLHLNQHEQEIMRQHIHLKQKLIGLCYTVEHRLSELLLSGPVFSEALQRRKRRCTMVQRKISDFFHNKGKIATFCTYFAFSSSTFPACDDFQYSYSFRFHILHGSHSVFGYPNSVPIDSYKRRSTVLELRNILNLKMNVYSVLGL
ncbi:hypothetical protein TNCV_4137061 [Trichonephila clavipes]|nr:hypothetical protein TNCV_4137061 [Trichonephila clavipes]